MRIASWGWGGRDHVGLVSADGREATPLLVDYAGGAAMRLIETLARGEELPAANGPRVAVDAITLRAPIPRPRRNIFCVGRHETHMVTATPAPAGDAHGVASPCCLGGRAGGHLAARSD